MTQELSPFDTGEAAEPDVWNPKLHLPSNWGKVDFEDDEGSTVCTTQVRRVDGKYQLHIWGAESMETVLHDSHIWLRHATEEEE